MHFSLFFVIVSAVSAVSALAKPVPLAKAGREALSMFFTTLLGMGAVALAIHLLSL